MIRRIVGLFVNPFTVVNEYSLLNKDYLYQHVQMHLSQKRKIISPFFFIFCKFRFNSEHLQKKGNPHS